MLPCVAATRTRTRVKDRLRPRSRAAQRSEATCATATVSAPPPLLLRASLIQPTAAARRHALPHCRSRKPSPSRLDPSSHHCHTFTVSHSIVSSAPPSWCYPRLSMWAAVAHLVLLPLHAGSAAPMLEAKPCRPSPVTRPPELCHCHSSSGAPRATAAVLPPTLTTRPYPVYSSRADHH
jgi:hypothetical protein